MRRFLCVLVKSGFVLVRLGRLVGVFVKKKIGRNKLTNLTTYFKTSSSSSSSSSSPSSSSSSSSSSFHFSFPSYPLLILNLQLLVLPLPFLLHFLCHSSIIGLLRNLSKFMSNMADLSKLRHMRGISSKRFGS